jgi:hypothetical protein
VNPHRAARFSGIASVVFFLASIAVSNAPANTASDATWVAAYATSTDQEGHLATGVLLVLTALSLLVFLTHLWGRIAAVRQPQQLTPLPLVAAGVSAACIAVGGALMAVISGSTLLFSQPLPRADLLRFANDAGFAMVGLAGMFAAALSIATLAWHASAAGVLGNRWRNFSLIAATVLLASIAFIPITALLIWLMVTTIALYRSPAATPASTASLA